MPVNTVRVVKNDKITGTCNVCGESTTVPNKGLGRAKLAAWETNHQH